MGKMLCARCGTVARPVSVAPGSILIELVLWLAFLVPGIVYTLWRMTSRKKTCRKCGSTELLPPDAPRAAIVVGEKPTASESRMPCPQCGESIAAAARKCRFCGYEIVRTAISP